MKTKKAPLMEIAKLHQTPVNKSKFNSTVNQLIEAHYEALSCELVRTEEDQGIFQDVVLSMTYKFKEGDFCQAFRKEFRSHKFRLTQVKYANRYRFCDMDKPELLRDPSDT